MREKRSRRWRELTDRRMAGVLSDGGRAVAKSLKTESGSGLLLVRYVRKPGTSAGAKPLKVLLILGGCCHDYAAQKDILKKGLEARANVQVDTIYSPDTSTHPPLPIFGKPDYARGYDVVLHDECAADISDPEIVRGVLAPHRQEFQGSTSIAPCTAIGRGTRATCGTRDSACTLV